MTWKWQDERAARADVARQDALTKARELQEGAERMNAANAALDLGELYADLGQWTRADNEFTRATTIRLRPDDILIRLERFRYHAERGEQAEAEKACAEVAGSGENDVGFRIKLGDACAELKQWPQARAQYAKAIDLGCTEGGIWFRHAMLQLYLGDQEGYRRTYARLLDRHGKDPDPTTAFFLTMVGYLAADPGVDPARVVQMGEIHAKADTVHGAVRLGIALFRAGRYDEAFPLLSRANRRYGWGRIKIALALTHYHRGEVEHAHRFMAQIGAEHRQVNPSATASWANNLDTQLLYRDAEAIIHSERWRNVFDLVRKQQPAEADRAVQKLLPAGPRHVADWHARGLYYLELGQWDKAARDYGEAIRRGANGVWEHWRMYARLCQLAGHREEYGCACAQIMERFGKTDDPCDALHVVMAC